MVPKGWSRSQIGEIANVQVGRDLIEDRYSEIEREFNFEVRHSPMPPDGTLRIP